MILNYYDITQCYFLLEYVQLYVDFLLNKSIYKQFAAFYYGFHSVCASYALLVRIKSNRILHFCFKYVAMMYL